MSNTLKPIIIVDDYGVVHTLHVSKHRETGDWRIKVQSNSRSAHLFVPEADLIAWLDDALATLDPDDE